MMIAYLCLAVFFLALLVFLYYFAYFCIFISERRFFQQKGLLPEYPLSKEREIKTTRSKRKKNLLIYCVIQSYLAQNNQEKARELFPFLKDDALLGIKKRNVQI